MASHAVADLKGDELLCHEGDGFSCVLTAHYYERSRNEIENAMKFYHHGCMIGYTGACMEEALIYCSGRGQIKQNETKGRNLITKACNMNDPKACYELALMHLKGECLAKKNKATARYFLRKACAYGDDRGCNEDIIDKK